MAGREAWRQVQPRRGGPGRCAQEGPGGASSRRQCPARGTGRRQTEAREQGGGRLTAAGLMVNPEEAPGIICWCVLSAVEFEREREGREDAKIFLA